MNRVRFEGLLAFFSRTECSLQYNQCCVVLSALNFTGRAVTIYTYYICTKT
jgi:hypothetical protein